MINRRHIRTKVMQAAYALLLAENDNLEAQEKYLMSSMDKMYNLYVLQYQIFIQLHAKALEWQKVAQNKHIPEGHLSEKIKNFVENRLLQQLITCPDISQFKFKKDDTQWKDHDEIINLLWQDVTQSERFENYLNLETTDYEKDKKFIVNLFKKDIAPNKHLYEFYENEVISWSDDIPHINTWIIENLKDVQEHEVFRLNPLFKELEHRDFARELFRKTILNYTKYEKEFLGKTPNWEADRITRVDKLLLVMAIAEFYNFPSIPPKVTINEYIEIAKDYATDKSSVFINGVLDKLMVEFRTNGKLQKTGRGLV